MSKVTIIGAGSAVFATEIMSDILSTPALETGTFALVDIHEGRLELAHQMAEFLIERSGRNWNVEASTDRTKVLADSHYVVHTIEVAGRENVHHDYDIPLNYGVDQCIGDTIGPGGLFKALRTLPVWLEILADVERLAPGTLVMNYTNPMSLTVLAGVRASKLSIVGLCHSIQHTSYQLAGYLDIPQEEIDWRAAGINHLAWFVQLSRDGQDLYPVLSDRIERHPEIYEQDPVRFEMMRELGAFVTESSGHTSEYTAYFRKRPDLIQKYTRSGYRGESGYYANNWPDWVEENASELRGYLSGAAGFELERGPEFASYIMEAIETGVPAVIYGNVPNTGLIDNLPQDGVVEVACLVDKKGIQPTHFGRLPTHLAALDAQHMAFHDLTAASVLEQDREAAVHALMIDPLTSAVCSLAEIRQMFDEMVAAQRDYLPEYLIV
ncbi:MAG: alpha-galactosidase [Chloroflexi bacterium]|nr:alpha-galactosidase [Chloroflexota bacterium]MCI0578085.1 alpha-galactosidase [Chloroflexota bacterium]MCI0646073.1 alpha-galactosidase [Chloroflexota bacterium]MCI0730989.1 alpha-galactosidase [Chloroflexota bacterium]